MISKFLKFGFLFFIIFGLSSNFVLADSNDNLEGHAWSSNIGWISFNCTNEAVPCATSNYGVNINSSTGYFSGYAWSSNIGWISFNRADTGAPPSDDICPAGQCLAKLNTSTNQIAGWARALANGGGWDGWIKLGEEPSAEWSPAVSVNTAPNPDELQGWAWGGDVTGWVSFNCANEGVCGASNYKVSFGNSPPSVGNLSFNLDIGSGPMCVSRGHFQWEFSDAESATQGAYRLQVSTNVGFTALQFDSGKVVSGAQERFIVISSTPIGEFDDGVADGDGQLAFNTPYYWRIEVFDDDDLGSGYANYPFNPFRTSLHPYPSVDFSWAPEKPSQDEPVQFADQTVFDPGSASQSWSWTFPPDAEPASSSQQNPQAVFGDDGPQEVTLLVTDNTLAADPNSGNGQCSKTDTINVKLPLPDFKEIPPVTFFETILYKLSVFFGKINISKLFA